MSGVVALNWRASPDEVYFGQKLVGLQYFLIMRPDLSREFL